MVSYNDTTATQNQEAFTKVLYSNLPFLALLTAEVLLAIFYIIQNGILYFLMAPMRCYGLVLSIYLFYQAHWKISDAALKQYALTGSPEAKIATS